MLKNGLYAPFLRNSLKKVNSFGGLKSAATKSVEPTVLLSLPELVGNGQGFKLSKSFIRQLTF